MLHIEIAVTCIFLLINNSEKIQSKYKQMILMFSPFIELTRPKNLSVYKMPGLQCHLRHE